MTRRRRIRILEVLGLLVAVTWMARGPIAAAVWNTPALVEADCRNLVVDMLLDASPFEGRPFSEMTEVLGEPDDRLDFRAWDAVWWIGRFGSFWRCLCADVDDQGLVVEVRVLERGNDNFHERPHELPRAMRDAGEPPRDGEPGEQVAR